ncbi:MAG: hypothetical protein N3E47_04630 [Candidatus Bathyarchaeota archaeon]|nr:hypothetical protein [Candidatus Bathyarchaeota archaeon]
MLEVIWFYLAVIFIITTVASIVLLLMERGKRGAGEGKEVGLKDNIIGRMMPLTVSRTLPDKMVSEAKDRLRVLDVEREILSYALRRLYEAHAEGKITADERDILASKYREDLERVKQEIARGESIIALSELEKMQEEFIKMFSERFEILNKRIEELRAIIGLPPTERAVKLIGEMREGEKPEDKGTLAQQSQVEKQIQPKRRRETAKPKATPEEIRSVEVSSVVGQPEAGEEGEEVSEADKRVEQIMAEIEKVLNKLSQMEVEE